MVKENSIRETTVESILPQFIIPVCRDAPVALSLPNEREREVTKREGRTEGKGEISRSSFTRIITVLLFI